MAWWIAKVFFSAAIISFTSWLANKKPGLSGFLVALPLTSILALAFNYTEFGESDKSVAFAKSIFYSVPLSLSFFVPFLLATHLRVPFWALFGLGMTCLLGAYFLHRLVIQS